MSVLYSGTNKCYYYYYNNVKSCDSFQINVHESAKWILKWQLVISLTKNIILHILDEIKNYKRVHDLNGAKISSATLVKDLGVYMSSHLSWKLQCTEMVKRANIRLQM